MSYLISNGNSSQLQFYFSLTTLIKLNLNYFNGYQFVDHKINFLLSNGKEMLVMEMEDIRYILISEIKLKFLIMVEFLLIKIRVRMHDELLERFWQVL